MSEEPITAYCVKCRAKRPMHAAQAVYAANGTPGTRGVCSVCGTASKRDYDRLVIVDSPAKARTISRFLGRDYVVKASIGHVRDLLRSQLSVDVENNFAPKYRVPDEKREVVKELKDAVQRAREVYLATDPDREGEAIAWHLVQATGADEAQVRRVAFHEITKEAIDQAFSQPRALDMNLINAQQARRILDRLVGYKLSPLLWAKVRNRTSAGRVQSVALRLIVEREREIAAFVPEEYWSIDAELAKRSADRPRFIAGLLKVKGEPVSLKNEAITREVVEDLEHATYIVAEVRRGERRRKPAPPFITSTLQQEASRRLGFTTRRTMQIAQQLYEGLDLGPMGGNVGLITYMRTDSTQVAASAQAEARAYVAQRFGPGHLPAAPPVHKSQVKGAQEAHEAIRPTSVFREPAKLQPYLNRDQLRLYTLIWQRFVASQMSSAVYDTVSVDVIADRAWSAYQQPANNLLPAERLAELLPSASYLLRASSARLKFAGFLAVYEESRDEDATPDQESQRWLPELQAGEVLDLVRLIPEQHFTEPPPRYTEATLVRALEENGIGRPSTYAPIISVIQDREYVERKDRRLVPTQLGFVVSDLLVEYFPDVVNVGFTADMEEDLDQIARGERDWVPVLREFYTPFAQAVERAEQIVQKIELDNQPTGETCEVCGHEMVVKWGRYGKFLACANFPTCRNTRPYLEKIGVTCPKCGGQLVERRGRRRRTFYGCANYPNCKFVSLKRPLPQPCPKCGGLMVEVTQRSAQCTQCQHRVALDALQAVPAPA